MLSEEAAISHSAPTASAAGLFDGNMAPPTTKEMEKRHDDDHHDVNEHDEEERRGTTSTTTTGDVAEVEETSGALLSDDEKTSNMDESKKIKKPAAARPIEQKKAKPVYIKRSSSRAPKPKEALPAADVDSIDAEFKRQEAVKVVSKERTSMPRITIVPC